MSAVEILVYAGTGLVAGALGGLLGIGGSVVMIPVITLIFKHNQHVSPDWRPEVHDSDGLEIHLGTGERLWRPLNNPPQATANSFQAQSPTGFGLMQRERNFSEYLD